ncbi:MAG: large-conductance mechanosensitive channel protein MscL [Planctomycetota bacterium]|nr:large-conductance mechanosensitive channel protein MscL [Planctomycetota bacterium]
MGMSKEFRDFAVKGNVMDMAVGIIIGGAFGTIVKSMVNDVIMPPIGLLMGGIDFSDLKIPLQKAAAPEPVVVDGVTKLNEAGEPVMTAAVEAVNLNYGLFINNVITFIIVAFAVFMLVKAMNAAKRKEEEAPAAPAAPPAQEVLLGEIRDLLKK